MLAKAGYKKDSSGYYALGGKEVAVTLIAPSAYTDYAAVGSMVANELKSAGINASFQGISVDAWNADMADGDFSLAEHWSNNGLTPYNLYDNWLNSALDNGKANTGDYEGLKNASDGRGSGQAGRRLERGAADRLTSPRSRTTSPRTCR